MNRVLIIYMTFLFLIAPLSVMGMQQEHGQHGHTNMTPMDHKGQNGMDHGGMAMQGNMILLGDSVQDGVKAMAHLKDVKEAMAKMGMKETHHIMVMFVDVASGKPVESGMAAVKVKGVDGKESEPIKLMGMQGHFGADIVLSGPGSYHFAIGTKLSDGKKRQFDFDFNLK